MVYYVKVEDSAGVIKSYFRLTGEQTAYKVYVLLVEEARHKGDRIQLMDEKFTLLAAFGEDKLKKETGIVL